MLTAATTMHTSDLTLSVLSPIVGVAVMIWYIRVTTLVEGGSTSKRGRIRYYRTPRQTVEFFSGLFLAVILSTYPLERIARLESTTAYLLDNLGLMLGAVPLFLLALPRPLVSRITRPSVIDRTLTAITRYAPATAIFSGSILASMLTPVVEAQAHSTLVRAALHLELLGAGAVMWIAALKILPGVRHLSVAGRIAFLFTQSLLPSFPAFALIFAHHAFYPVFAHRIGLLGISAIGDQQLAGGLSKVLSIAVLWGASVAILLRAQANEDQGEGEEPITWDDVERELERTSRRSQRRE
jgi:putative membrane protein